MQPFVMTQIATGICSTIMYPDINQNPFNIGIGATLASGASVSALVEHTFDFTTVMNPTFDGVRAWTVLPGGFSTVLSTATWFVNSAFSTAGVPGISVGSTEQTRIQGNYAFAVAAIRMQVATVTA